MAETGGVSKEGIDLDAILDAALAAPKPKGRPKTKTEQLRERREKLKALQAKGYTESELAQLTGVSKDTLRKALKPTKDSKVAKAGNRAARAAKPSVGGDGAPVTVTRKASVTAGNAKDDGFPTSSRF